jgi:hypothetical protein
MDPIDASLMTMTITNYLAGHFVKICSDEYWKRVVSGVSRISSYQDIITNCLIGLKAQASQIPPSADRELAKQSMSKIERCFDVLKETYNKYNIT